MLITTILSSLGLSVLADEQNDEKEGYYTIFEWNDGMKIQRALVLDDKLCRFGTISYLRFGDQLFYLFGIHYFDINKSSYFIGSDTRPRPPTIGVDYVDPGHRLQQHLMPGSGTLVGLRIAWLALIYLQCDFSRLLDTERIGIPNLTSEALVNFASGGAPDKADPYEMTVYETGQMDKSLFMLSQDDFLKTIGEFKC